MRNPFKKLFSKSKDKAPKVKVLPEVKKPEVSKADHKDGGPMDYDILNVQKRWSSAHRRRNDMKKATQKGAKHKRMSLKLVLNEDKMRFKVTP